MGLNLSGTCSSLRTWRGSERRAIWGGSNGGTPGPFSTSTCQEPARSGPGSYTDQWVGWAADNFAAGQWVDDSLDPARVYGVCWAPLNENDGLARTVFGCDLPAERLRRARLRR